MLWRLEEVFGSAGSMQLWVLALWGWSVEVISPVSWTWESLQLSITPSQSAEHRQRVLLSLVAGGLQVMVPVAEPCLWLLPGLWARGRSSGNNWELGGFFFFFGFNFFYDPGQKSLFLGPFLLGLQFLSALPVSKKVGIFSTSNYCTGDKCVVSTSPLLCYCLWIIVCECTFPLPAWDLSGHGGCLTYLKYI